MVIIKEKFSQLTCLSKREKQRKEQIENISRLFEAYYPKITEIQLNLFISKCKYPEPIYIIRLMKEEILL